MAARIEAREARRDYAALYAPLLSRGEAVALLTLGAAFIGAVALAFGAGP